MSKEASREGRRATPRARPEEPWPRACAAGIDDFLEALRIEAGLARNTLSAYRRDLRDFFAWCARQAPRQPTCFGDLEAEGIIDYLAHCRDRGLSDASVARRLSALRMCLHHQVAEGRLARDPLVHVSAPLLRRALPTTLTVEDVERLLAAPAGSQGATGDRAWRAQRDTALIEVLYASGARVAEAVGLRTADLEPSLGVLVLHGKGRKTRVVPLGGRARAALRTWMSEGRPHLLGHRRCPQVFLTKSGRPLDRVSAWRLVKAAAQSAGLPATISPHTLRHSFASHLIEGGADLRSVQEMLGHASIRTTEIYTHLDADHVRSLHRMYHPRG